MKSRLRCFLITFWFSLAIVVSVYAQSPNDTTFYLGGIQVGEYDQSAWTNALQFTGMNTVEVTVYARQGEWDSDNLWFEEEDQGAMNQIRAAKKAGLKVVLILRVALDHVYERNRFLWHGMILPKSKSSIKSWFKKYTKFVLKWSEIAEKEGIEVVVIGSELNALSTTVPVTEMSDHYRFMLSDSTQRVRENRALKYEQTIGKELWVQGYEKYDSLETLIDDRITANRNWAQQITFSGYQDSLERMNKRRAKIHQHWNRLIRKTRRSFSDKISYAANFDNYFDVYFWDKLDFIGINAYFPLRQLTTSEFNQNSLKNELKDGWNEVFDGIETFQSTYELEDVPLLFTELGYTYYSDAIMEPWSGFGYSIVLSEDETAEKLIIWNQQKIQYEERAMAISILQTIVKSRAINLQGLLYWKFTTMPSQLEIEPFAILLNPEEATHDPAVMSLQSFLK